eukprot:COSAG01_NODE_2_length_63927_cov_1357.611941_34_plen_579_part_00
MNGHNFRSYTWLVNKFFTYLFCFLFCYIGCVEAHRYDSQRYKFHVEGLPEWHLVELKKDKEIAFVQPEGLATINVTAFYFLEEVTANGLQKIRMGSRYDGWVNLFERPATEKEMLAANVSDAYRAVYSKHVMNDNFVLSEFLTAEFYFVDGLNAYVISLETHKTDFQAVQVALQEILDGFWVGNQRIVKTLQIREKTYEDWTMVGQNAQNNRYVKSDNFSVNHVQNLLWQDEFLLSSNVKLAPISDPIFVDKQLFFVYGDTLYCYLLETGKQSWSYRVPGISPSSLLYADGLLFFVQDQPEQIVALLADLGNVLYEYPLKGPVSKLVYDSGALFFVDKSVFYQLEFESGATLFKYDKVDFSHEFYPVVSKNQVLVVSNRVNELYLLDTKQKEYRWKKNLSGRLVYSPIIRGDQFVLATEENGLDDRFVQVNAYSLDSAQLQWIYNFARMPAKFLSAPIVSPTSILLHVDMLAHRLQERGTLHMLDLRTGKRLWETYFLLNGGDVPAVMTSKTVLLRDQALFKLRVFDSLTGESFAYGLTPFIRSLDLAASSQQSFYLYHESLLFMTVSDGRFLLSYFK